MINFLAAATLMAHATDYVCPPIHFAELQPDPGHEYIYSFWLDGELQDGALRIKAAPARDDAVRVELSFRLPNGEWTPVQHHRSIAAVVLHHEDELNGIARRQINVRPIDPPLLTRSISEDEEIRMVVLQTARQNRWSTLRNEGEMVLAHAGCGTLMREGEAVRTRRLRATYPRYIAEPGGGWQLEHQVLIFDIPLDANWFYSRHRESNHPMQQGTLMQGYTAP